MQKLKINIFNSISVICPVYNEEKFIEKVILFFINANPQEKQLIIVDGGSTDRTTEIVKKISSSFPDIILLHNDERYVPFALNMAIKYCKYDIIARIDAHCEYASDYFEKIIETFNTVDADIVGGPTNVKSKTLFQRAVGKAICSKFGIGDSKVHDKNFRGYVDHVTFGAWKKILFSEVGLFDERLYRNQDDEFHYRAKSKGKKVFLNPDIHLWYYPRNSLYSLMKQYYQYGLYKPLVLLKVKSELKLRHLIPSIFFVYLLVIPFILSSFISIPLISYLILDLVFTFNSDLSFKGKILLFFLFPAIHLSYGCGFIFGIFKLLSKRN